RASNRLPRGPRRAWLDLHLPDAGTWRPATARALARMQPSTCAVDETSDMGQRRFALRRVRRDRDEGVKQSLVTRQFGAKALQALMQAQRVGKQDFLRSA